MRGSRGGTFAGPPGQRPAYLPTYLSTLGYPLRYGKQAKMEVEYDVVVVDEFDALCVSRPQSPADAFGQ